MNEVFIVRATRWDHTPVLVEHVEMFDRAFTTESSAREFADSVKVGFDVVEVLRFELN